MSEENPHVGSTFDSFLMEDGNYTPRKLDLVFYPNPILRQVSENVETFDDDLKVLIADMKHTMVEENGAGLAAPQVGILKRIFVFDSGNGIICVLINPVIVEFGGNYTMDGGEGCLSLPKGFADVDRSRMVRVAYRDENGDPHEVTATEQYAVCIQHEIDHLDGKLFIDYLSPLKRDLVERKVKKALKGS
jgi:peptide deformylase